MMHYEEERTRSIVQRLVALEPLLRAAVMAGWAIGLGVIVSFLSALFLQGSWWLGGLIGAAVGYGIGSVIASFFSLVAEALAQSLVAQSEIWVKLQRGNQ